MTLKLIYILQKIESFTILIYEINLCFTLSILRNEEARPLILMTQSWQDCSLDWPNSEVDDHQQGIFQ